MARFFNKTVRIASSYDGESSIVLYEGDCLQLLQQIPDQSIQLIVTSPPYNIGKQYEQRKALSHYLEFQKRVIEKCISKLTPSGSICWQVGNHVSGPQAIVPLDIALHPFFVAQELVLRNRIIWRFEHGLHCSKRFSGRYETIMWYTRNGNYVFNLDMVRVPQKYPGKKYFRGPKAGQYSCNPLGKNPGDVWDIPNVKHNHIEKTEHPCQFPVELVQRLVLALTNEGDSVLDPFAGVGSSLIAASNCHRRGLGAELSKRYCTIAKQRLERSFNGTLKVRQMGQPVYSPPGNSCLAKNPFSSAEQEVSSAHRNSRHLLLPGLRDVLGA